MTLKRFKNELIVLMALLFALYAFSYKLSAKNFVSDKKNIIQSSIREITRVSELKKLWANKKTSKQAKIFKTIVSSNKIESFKKTSEKVTVSYSNLTINELNKITKKFMNTPFQITKLKIDERGKEKYSMELTCKW